MGKNAVNAFCIVSATMQNESSPKWCHLCYTRQWLYHAHKLIFSLDSLLTLHTLPAISLRSWRDDCATCLTILPTVCTATCAGPSLRRTSCYFHLFCALSCFCEYEECSSSGGGWERVVWPRSVLQEWFVVWALVCIYFFVFWFFWGAYPWIFFKFRL